MNVKHALTIAGSDSGGGAGIQADLKVFQELQVYGMSAITAVTAQNTLGVHGVYPMTVEAVEAQLTAVGEDLGVDALKTGMLFSSEIIKGVANKIRYYEWKNIVIDPVMIAKGGSKLLEDEAVTAIIHDLIPLSTVITPNIPEAEVLTGAKIVTIKDRKDAAVSLSKMGTKSVVIKGGHAEDGENVIDLFYDGEEFYEFKNIRKNTVNTHGTGCTFSAAIAAELAKGKEIVEAVRIAVMFTQAAIKEDLNIGQGHGPTNHWAYNRQVNRGSIDE
ncbi:bifunctional hydroxymethylpyrimidine kinase/phosphomethylpyrimidine kinase [Salipaludibacillus sp. CF4.18]|uniref:bifunctional hydroxymethylpyrimidine kinase/phosphomethylpyrimidine kinase n=1 Tax=Salipaludibacillus sp. CF4.18 TaxID=3373081 RepID=UPI003EE50296